MRKSRPRNSTAGASAAEGEAAPTSGPPNIPTDLLRTFVAICELGSFTKAAHLFDLTQPAVSAHMRRLEAIIGADLIEKSLSGVTLTESGTEVLRHARRMLSINDQIVSGAPRQQHPQVIRLGIPNLYTPNKLGRILTECAASAGGLRLQVCCDQSPGLLRSVRAGYLDLAALLAYGDDELESALVTWTAELAWVRARDFVLKPGQPVPLVSSPNLLMPDKIAMKALEQANLPYEIVFTAFDTLARRAAAAAGLGYFVLPRAVVLDPLVIEAPGVLPDLPKINMGIVARDDLDPAPLAPLISAVKAVLSSET
jgi:DNA-binding transcriptional LysR family regulator